MGTHARAPAGAAEAPLAVVLADTGAPALLADVPAAVMLADAGAPAVLAGAPAAIMVADVGAPAVLSDDATFSDAATCVPCPSPTSTPWALSWGFTCPHLIDMIRPNLPPTYCLRNEGNALMLEKVQTSGTASTLAVDILLPVLSRSPATTPFCLCKGGDVIELSRPLLREHRPASPAEH